MSSAYVTPKLTSSARDARPGSWWRTILRGQLLQAQPVPRTMMIILRVLRLSSQIPKNGEKSYDAARTRGWDAGGSN